MTWTNTNAPGTTSPEGRRDFVRLNVGDTVETDQLVSDEAIAAALGQVSDDIYLASAIIARAIAASFMRASDIAMGEGALAVSDSAIAQGYMDLAKRMESQAKKLGGASIGLPKAGGLTLSELETLSSDTDWNKPAFRENKFQNLGGYNDKTVRED